MGKDYLVESVAYSFLHKPNFSLGIASIARNYIDFRVTKIVYDIIGTIKQFWAELTTIAKSVYRNLRTTFKKLTNTYSFYGIKADSSVSEKTLFAQIKLFRDTIAHELNLSALDAYIVETTCWLESKEVKRIKSILSAILLKFSSKLEHIKMNYSVQNAKSATLPNKYKSILIEKENKIAMQKARVKFGLKKAFQEYLQVALPLTSDKEIEDFCTKFITP